MKVTQSFVSGAAWEPADVEGVALARIIEVARAALYAHKLDRGKKVNFAGVTMRRLGQGRLIFANFSVGDDWSVSIAVNALFQTIVPEEK